MPYGTANVDVIQSSVSGTPPQFNDGNGTQVGTLCRAWVNYKGTATRGINASFNVSSVTYNAAGDYTINFTNALADANYAACVSSTNRGGGSLPTANYSAGYGSASSAATNGTYSTTALEIYVQGSTGTGVDIPTVSVSVFR